MLSNTAAVMQPPLRRFGALPRCLRRLTRSHGNPAPDAPNGPEQAPTTKSAEEERRIARCVPQRLPQALHTKNHGAYVSPRWGLLAPPEDHGGMYLRLLVICMFACQIAADPRPATKMHNFPAAPPNAMLSPPSVAGGPPGCRSGAGPSESAARRTCFKHCFVARNAHPSGTLMSVRRFLQNHRSPSQVGTSCRDRTGWCAHGPPAETCFVLPIAGVFAPSGGVSIPLLSLA